MSDITIEKLHNYIFSVTAENFDLETLDQALLLMNSLELTREQRDGILQITEVSEHGFSYTTELQEPIAQYVGIYLLSAYYEEYCPNNNLTYLRPKFPKVRRTYHHRKKIEIPKIPENISNITSLVTLDIQNTSIDSLPYSIVELPNLKNLYFVGTSVQELYPSLQAKSLQLFDIENMIHDYEDIEGVSRGNNIFYHHVPEIQHPFSKVLYNEVYGDEYEKEGGLILELKNSKGEPSNYVQYDMTARYDMYCDDGSDGYGEFSCEEINSDEIESQIISMLKNRVPYVDRDPFLKRPDYTITKLVDCIPHPNDVNETVMTYNAEATAKLVLQQLKKVERRIAQVRVAWKKVLENNTKEE
jgi:hypothetical protein